MNDFFLWLGLDGWRPVLSSVIMPPVPFLVLIVFGAHLFSRYRLRAWLVVFLGCLGIWASCTYVVGHALTQWLLPPVRTLNSNEVAELKKAPRTAIVVLGAGHRDIAPEYGVSELLPMGVERLRYGLWLSRQTELPVLFAGGRGHGSPPGQSEAEIAARIAERDFNRPLRWTETESRDTRENALRSVSMLRAQGIDRIVVVTHGYHMPRAMENFRRAVALGTTDIKLVAAPLALEPWMRARVIDFIPTRNGFSTVRLVLHEYLGRLIGA